jgi:hypothetical protein
MTDNKLSQWLPYFTAAVIAVTGDLHFPLPTYTVSVAHI